MAKKQQLEKRQLGPALPNRFEPDRLYKVVVASQFSINKFPVRPGVALLRGDVAEMYRGHLQSAWPAE